MTKFLFNEYLALDSWCKYSITAHVKSSYRDLADQRVLNPTMHMTPALMSLLAVYSSAAADPDSIHLYMGTNDGNLTSLRLSISGGGYTFAQTSVTGSCGTQPVWLDLNKPNNVLHCLNRPGSITTYRTSENGELGTPLNTGYTTIGPVSSAFYNRGEKRGLAAAH